MENLVFVEGLLVGILDWYSIYIYNVNYSKKIFHTGKVKILNISLTKKVKLTSVQQRRIKSQKSHSVIKNKIVFTYILEKVTDAKY